MFRYVAYSRRSLSIARVHVVLMLLLLACLEQGASGQGRVFLVPAGHDPNASTPGSNYFVSASGGDTLTVEVYVDVTPDQHVRTVGAGLPCHAPCSYCGHVSYVPDSVAVDRAHKLYIFDGGSVDPSIDHRNCPVHEPRFGTYADFSEEPPLVVGNRYVGQAQYRLSRDCVGDALIGIHDKSDTAIIDETYNRMPISTNGLRIRSDILRPCDEPSAFTDDFLPVEPIGGFGRSWRCSGSNEGNDSVIVGISEPGLPNIVSFVSVTGYLTDGDNDYSFSIDPLSNNLEYMVETSRCNRGNECRLDVSVTALQLPSEVEVSRMETSDMGFDDQGSDLPFEPIPSGHRGIHIIEVLEYDGVGRIDQNMGYRLLGVEEGGPFEYQHGFDSRGPRRTTTRFRITRLIWPMEALIDAGVRVLECRAGESERAELSDVLGVVIPSPVAYWPDDKDSGNKADLEMSFQITRNNASPQRHFDRLSVMNSNKGFVRMALYAIDIKQGHRTSDACLNCEEHAINTCEAEGGVSRYGATGAGCAFTCGNGLIFGTSPFERCYSAEVSRPLAHCTE